MVFIAICLAAGLAANSVVTVVLIVRQGRLIHLYRALEEKHLSLEMLNANMRRLWRRELDKFH